MWTSWCVGVWVGVVGGRERQRINLSFTESGWVSECACGARWNRYPGVEDTTVDPSVAHLSGNPFTSPRATVSSLGGVEPADDEVVCFSLSSRSLVAEGCTFRATLAPPPRFRFALGGMPTPTLRGGTAWWLALRPPRPSTQPSHPTRFLLPRSSLTLPSLHLV